MKTAKCDPSVIAYACHRKCPTCVRRSAPGRMPRVTTPYRPTRFDQVVGMDLKTIKDIPNLIKSKNFPNEIDIRGEVFIQNSDFEKFKNKFANPRNAASGSLRQKDPKETKKIQIGRAHV